MSGGGSSRSRSLSASAFDAHAQLRRKSAITTTSERMGAGGLAIPADLIVRIPNLTVVINIGMVVFCNQYGLPGCLRCAVKC